MDPTDWTAPFSSSQIPRGPGMEEILNPLTDNSTPSSALLQSSALGIPNTGPGAAYDRIPLPKPLFSATPSMSGSTDSIPQSLQSLASYGPGTVWSSIESFPSITTNGPTIEQYRTLTSQLNETRRENAELLKHNRILGAKLDTLSKAYETLANRIPQILSSPTTLQEVREKNPNIKYWTRQDWTTANSDRVADLNEGSTVGARGRTRAAKGINVNMKYVETKDGQPISGHLASDIRRHARAIFVGLALEGHLFTSWTEADHNSLKVYYREMAERFEELKLCANDWKSEAIALDIYRTWREQWQKKKTKTEYIKNRKPEDDKDCDDFDDSGDEESESAKKHDSGDYVSSENQRVTKKIKSNSSTSEPTSSLHMMQTHSIPSINIIPGTPAQVEKGKTVPHYQTPFQPMPPALQQSFNIVNPFQLPSSAISTTPPFVAVPHGVQPSQQFSSNVPTFVAFNAATNEVSQTLPSAPSASKSRRMRPTKSVTARNLCAIDWCKSNKGTADDFNKFWNTLPKDEKERYETLSKERSEQEKSTAMPTA